MCWSPSVPKFLLKYASWAGQPASEDATVPSTFMHLTVAIIRYPYYHKYDYYDDDYQ